MQIPNLKYEKELWQNGYEFIAGVDESGCGPWAGPLVAAAVILPYNKRIKKIRDSKLLNTNLREKLYQKIKNESLTVSVFSIEASKIDELGVRLATKVAMKNALKKLKIKPQFVLIDAFELDINLPQKAIIHGDNVSLSIAAASIMAKVERDRIMLKLHKKYPLYQFDKHKGYGTKLHQRLLKLYGPSDIHRKSFKPIKDLL